MEYQNWRAELIAQVGKHLGYPQCCCESFVTNDPPWHENQFEASKINNKPTGFIPCLQCANRIINNEITLVELIKDRENKGIFPEVNEEQFEKITEPLIRDEFDEIEEMELMEKLNLCENIVVNFIIETTNKYNIDISELCHIGSTILNSQCNYLTDPNELYELVKDIEEHIAN